MNPRQAKLLFLNRRIDLQIAKMDQALDRYNQRDKALFARVTDAMIKKDTARFNVFCHELREVRNLAKTFLTSRIALKEAYDRIQKQTEAESPDTGDLTVSAQLLSNARTRVVAIFPDAENEISEIYNMLSGVIVDVITEDVDKKGSITEMYKRVELEAENQMKDKLPSIPEMTPPSS